MASAQIQTLLRGPDIAQSRRAALEYLNANFTSLADLDDPSRLEKSVQEAQVRSDELHHRVRAVYVHRVSSSRSKSSVLAQLFRSQEDLDNLILNTRSSAEKYLHDAQELSLLRHSLADELSSLSDDLVSSMTNGDGEPTLLEDLETLHRRLKELEHVKGYVQVIEHALKLK